MGSLASADARGLLHVAGRFSGGSHGFVVGHVSPEAQVGGPIALVENGDRIKVDAETRVMEVLDMTDEVRCYACRDRGRRLVSLLGLTPVMCGGVSDADVGGAQGEVGGAASQGDKRHAVQIHQECGERLAGLHHRPLNEPKTRRRRCCTRPPSTRRDGRSATTASRGGASASCQGRAMS